METTTRGGWPYDSSLDSISDYGSVSKSFADRLDQQTYSSDWEVGELGTNVIAHTTGWTPYARVKNGMLLIRGIVRWNVVPAANTLIVQWGRSTMGNPLSESGQTQDRRWFARISNDTMAMLKMVVDDTYIGFYITNDASLPTATGQWLSLENVPPIPVVPPGDPDHPALGAA